MGALRPRAGSVAAHTPKPQAPRPIRYRGVVVGHVDADRVFWRRVRASHILRKPPAIALHEAVLEALAASGADVVAFQLDDGAILTGPLTLYRDRGIPINRAGFGAQRAVLLSDFLRVDVHDAAPADALAFVEALG